MENNRIAFCNVSFGKRYVKTQSRLKDSILSVHPDAELFFWTDSLPEGSKPFQQSLYGFKPHAVRYARDKGFSKVVWIDTCAVLKQKVDALYKENFIAAKDDSKLYRYSGFELIEDKEKFLVGGSVYLFNFNKKLYSSVFDDWFRMEQNGLFGTQEFIMKENNDGLEKCGHRMDETCMAISIYENGLKPFSGELYYETVEKLHFLKDGEKWYQKL